MNRARIQIAKPDILKLFDELQRKVHKLSELQTVLAENRGFWRLTRSMTSGDFIRFLTATGKLRRIVFPFPKPYNKETRYVWGNVPFDDVVLTLRPNCHFSHYTALSYHGLTEQAPKTTYVNFEQPLASNSATGLSQRGINIAFKNSVRTTSYVAETDEFRVCVLNGKNTGYLGVINEQRAANPHQDIPAGRVRVTNVERTLIDATVRPSYAGGVHEVLKAFTRAKETSFSVNRLAAMLQQLAYIYPYHQAIGFYLERAGYRSSLLDLLRRFPMEFDFYLTHQMKETEYVKAWRLHVPKGL
jgi:hypothetical protein